MILRNTAVVLKTSSFVRRAHVCNDIVQLNIGKLVAEINLVIFFYVQRKISYNIIYYGHGAINYYLYLWQYNVMID